MMNNSEFVDKYKLLEKDPKFQKELASFLEVLVKDVRNENLQGENVDNRIRNFLEKYVKQRRNRKINKILRKEDI